MVQVLVGCEIWGSKIKLLIIGQRTNKRISKIIVALQNIYLSAFEIKSRLELLNVLKKKKTKLDFKKSTEACL